MKAIIIAAGAGTRFGKITLKKPKPLIQIYGKPLIKWVMDSLILGGVSEIYIVIGYKGDQIKRELGNKYKGINIHFINNPVWEKGNLTSLYIARSYMNTNEFILSMSDHLFDPAIVRLIVEKNSKTTVLLAVDRKYQQTSDDMKVLVKNNHIKDIGKDIVGNFVDIGLFKMKYKIFKYAEKVLKEKKYNLFEVVKNASNYNDAMVINIKRRFWIDIDTLEELNSYYVQKFPKFIKSRKWD